MGMLDALSAGENWVLDPMDLLFWEAESWLSVILRALAANRVL